jgi:hypothetical protein
VVRISLSNAGSLMPNSSINMALSSSSSWEISCSTFAQNAIAVVSYEDFMKYKSLNACKEHGVYRLEGKQYIVQDGDILNIRFNV